MQDIKNASENSNTRGKYKNDNNGKPASRHTVIFREESEAVQKVRHVAQKRSSP